MRFWIYFKGNNNGQLLVGYRYTPESDIQPLTFTNYQSCYTNSTQCSWQRIDVALSTVLTQRTEVCFKNSALSVFIIKKISFIFI